MSVPEIIVVYAALVAMALTILWPTSDASIFHGRRVWMIGAVLAAPLVVAVCLIGFPIAFLCDEVWP